jgi:hypothetical protein
MPRQHQINVRLANVELAQLKKVCEHYDKTDSEAIRYLISQAAFAIAAGDAKPLDRYQFACDRLKVTRENLQRLINANLLSDPPERAEIQDWLDDSTRRSPQQMLKQLARPYGSR